MVHLKVRIYPVFQTFGGPNSNYCLIYFFSAKQSRFVSDQFSLPMFFDNTWHLPIFSRARGSNQTAEAAVEDFV